MDEHAKYLLNKVKVHLYDGMFRFWHTGGGCTCWGVNMYNEVDALITAIEDAVVPKRGEKWCISVYDDDGINHMWNSDIPWLMPNLEYTQHLCGHVVDGDFSMSIAQQRVLCEQLSVYFRYESF